MVRNRKVFVMGLTAILGACVHPPNPRAGAVGGCFTAEIGDWTPPTELSSRLQPPGVFELLEETGEGMLEGGKTIVRPVIEGYGNPSAYWAMPSSDSLIVTWTDGFDGIRLRVTRAAEGWTGIANPITDVWIEGRPTPTAPVTIKAVPCT